MPTAATSGVSAIAFEGEAMLDAAREPAPSSKACRRDHNFALVS